MNIACPIIAGFLFSLHYFHYFCHLFKFCVHIHISFLVFVAFSILLIDHIYVCVCVPKC